MIFLLYQTGDDWIPEVESSRSSFVIVCLSLLGLL